MASVYLRGKTYWVIYYDRGRKVQRSLRTRDYTVAKYKNNQIEQALAENKKPPQLRAYSIQKALDEYLAVAEASQTLKSFKTARGRLMGFINSLKVANLQDITSAHIQSYIAKKVQVDKIRSKTANHTLTGIKAFLNFCMKHGYLGQNPVDLVDRLKVPNTPGEHLSEREIQRLLTVSQERFNSRYHPILATAIFAGLRLGELLALEWQDVDFRRQKIMVKDKPEQGLRTKTGKFREVPLHQQLRDVLYPLKQPSGFCFFPDKPVRGNTSHFYIRFKRLLKDAKMPQGTNWLTLRRTFGSLLAQNGAGLVKIQAWMGHSDPRLTITHYAHLQPGYDEDINKIPTIDFSPNGN